MLTLIIRFIFNELQKKTPPFQDGVYDRYYVLHNQIGTPTTLFGMWQQQQRV